MGVLDTLIAALPPDQVMRMLNGVSDEDLRRSLRQLLPQVSPAKFMVFIDEVSAEMARRYPGR